MFYVSTSKVVMIKVLNYKMQGRPTPSVQEIKLLQPRSIDAS